MSEKQDYRLTKHAHEEAVRRNIPLAIIESIVLSPEQIVNGNNNRRVYQSRVTINK